MCDFRDMYKNVNQLKEHQSTRRARLLDHQRKHRDDQFALRRDLIEILSNSKHKRSRINGMFKNKIMLSEWMLTKPDDIEDFLMKPCPKGETIYNEKYN